MAVGVGHFNGGNGRRGRKRNGYVPMAEINVTPFVDVMLVLLIIFMVAAPLLTVGVPIELPETQAKALEGDKEPLTVTVSPEGQIFLQETEVDLDTLVPKLIAITDSGYDERIYVRGDRNVNYGTVMQVMGAMNAAGFRRIGLVTDSEDKR
ncbi:protein TolR [Kaustia mangrovi]|uniref:Protein TolR n=1 Tax=Kaustia mangrovi TaxID=2593653 RepID=A0A7S8C5U3_9HYPH|nr:protein TolR [Kaustia mangrovi]QPC43946.1 protein TolR [Kaustia mangrovi]